ncbi:MAG TPA: NAD(P)/FAD-dependent oxidoreductase [Candidatus Cybelea sp.]|nr:NAD(P)/FAD-dependent oxidoreductase [Candidatus Cybelea sp.]
MYDVIVVGARCAGASTAMLLARRGHKVLMVDRATFPSDTMSTHFIHVSGVARLRRWGVLDRLQATDAPAERTLTVDFGPVVLTGNPAPAECGTDVSYAPRRKIFDALLIDAAVESGVEFRQGVRVRELIFEDGRVAGICGEDSSGARFEARARAVVGADGRDSLVARAAGATEYFRRPSATCNYYSYWSGFNAPHTHLFIRPGNFFVVGPTNAALTLAVAVWPVDAFVRVRRNPLQAYLDALASVPWIRDRLATATRVEKLVGTAHLESYFRKPFGPGWALVGDAGHNKDPITAQGMSDAFRDAELLAEALDAALSGRRGFEDALGEYQARRDEASIPMHELTDDLARLAPPPPEMKELVHALEGNPREIGRFLGVMAGTVPVREFFAPDNVARIVADARLAMAG